MHMRTAEKLETRFTVVVIVAALFLTGDPPVDEPQAAPPIDTSTWEHHYVPCAEGGMMLTSYPPVCLEDGAPP